MIVSDVVGPQESIRIDRYRNADLTDWVNKHFRTLVEKCAAWDMFAYICNTYPAARDIVRGELIESEEY